MNSSLLSEFPAIVGVIVMLCAYVFPQLIPHGLNFIH